MLTYKLVVETLSEIVNKSEYFNPFFSWVIIAFTFFSIGIHGGPIWKYLFYCATIGFIAISCAFCYTIAENLNYKVEMFVKLIWVEGYLWTINEWFYVYINYVKIQTCIKSLRKQCIKIILYMILGYSLYFRTRLNMKEYDIKWYTLTDKKYNQEEYEKERSKYITFLYLPPGIICAVFIFYIIKELLQENSNYQKNVLSSFLHSTLSRMLIVSIIFIGISIIVLFKEEGVAKFIRNLFVRLKGNLGLIFLIDILLLRIDLDHNQIALQDQEIEKMNVGKTIQSQFDNYNGEEQLSIDKVNKLLSDNNNNNLFIGNEFIFPPENLYLSDNGKKGKYKKSMPTDIYLKQHLNSKYINKHRQDQEHSNHSGKLPYMISKSLDEEDHDISNNGKNRKLKDYSKNGGGFPYMISRSLDDSDDEQNFEKLYNTNPLSSYLSNMSNGGNKSPGIKQNNNNYKTGISPNLSSNNSSYIYNTSSNIPLVTTSYKNNDASSSPPPPSSQSIPINRSPVNTKGNAKKHPGNIVMESELRQYEE
ncbi:hypothetical protein PIROE2DRAFT_3993 [Piromyces sp. E2]|nr:hypothetical protein PIROE2DRAFT_3993 [Piromyces sp. E2]|eukprot:OUM68389.1 hypothetical protein PIROE2DRAFT_3993 [Piromyces sp. E2]